jgi:hypothetical protein
MTSAGSLHPQVNVEYSEEIQKKVKGGEYQPASDDPLNLKDIISNIWEQPPTLSSFHPSAE